MLLTLSEECAEKIFTNISDLHVIAYLEIQTRDNVVEKYNEYHWCGCGYGKTCQPFCDKRV